MPMGFGANLNIQMNGATFKDLAGNNAACFLHTNMFFPLSTAKVDGVPPTASEVNALADGVYGLGSTLNFNIVYSEVVNVVGGTPSLTLKLGNKNVNATYVGGTGTSTLAFTMSLLMATLPGMESKCHQPLPLTAQPLRIILETMQSLPLLNL